MLMVPLHQMPSNHELTSGLLYGSDEGAEDEIEVDGKLMWLTDSFTCSSLINTSL